MKCKYEYLSLFQGVQHRPNNGVVGGGGIYLFIFLNLSQELIAVHGITALLQSNYILVHFVPVLSLSHRLFHFRFRYKYYESVIITPLSYTVGIIII